MTNKRSFETNLATYAKLLVVQGMNVQPGQFVQILFEAGISEELALLAAEYAYEYGARHVQVSYSHPRIKRAQLEKGPVDDRFYFPLSERMRSEHIVDAQGCILDLRTNSEPDLFNDMAELASDHRVAYMRMRARFYNEGINKGKVSWCLACPPSPKAALKVYPDAPSLDDAYRAYWEAIFRMTMADQEDCIERWKKLDQKLHDRRRLLDGLGIGELQFEGPGTSLTVGLSRKANWLGGSKKTSAGKSFTANVPSFEVFTTPDWRMTKGHVRITRPINVAGVLVEGLELTFKNGELSDFTATSNSHAYESLIKKDAGARRLGEVALVGCDSPVYQEGVVFNNTLYDENAACHIATGNGYAVGIQGGWDMDNEALRQLGRNESITHEDVMISGPGVNVTAITTSDHDIELIHDGLWTDEFA